MSIAKIKVHNSNTKQKTVVKQYMLDCRKDIFEIDGVLDLHIKKWILTNKQINMQSRICIQYLVNYNPFSLDSFIWNKSHIEKYSIFYQFL